MIRTEDFGTPKRIRRCSTGGGVRNRIDSRSLLSYNASSQQDPQGRQDASNEKQCI